MDSEIDVLQKFCDRIDADPGLLMERRFDFVRSWMVRHANFDETDVFASKDETPSSDSDDDEMPPPSFEYDGGIDEDGATRATEDALRESKPEEAIRLYDIAIRKHATSRRYADRGARYLDVSNFEMALRDAEAALELNRDSVRALRVRSRAKWMLNDNSAYIDMCEAQRLDYSDEYDALHNQMKLAHESVGASSTASDNPPNTLPNMPNIPPNMMPNIDQLMGNPAVMSMAQNLMANPELMQQMLGSFGKPR